eukprot:423215_1
MKTTFYKNNNFNAMIMQNNVAGNVLISSCGFIANYNNTYLVNVINIPYSTTISILYTMISDNNQCLSNHCLSFMNSNLLIDEISLSPGTATPTTAPTATPSAAPSTAPSVPPTNYPTIPSFSPTQLPSKAPIIITGNYFDCGALKCANRNVYCADNEDCYVRCEARWACSNTNIYCPSNEYNCTVYCRWQRACSQANIFGGGGDLMVESDASNTGGTNGKEIFYQTEINCPIQHQCIVESFGHPYDQSCVINGLSASILNISITGYARSWTVNCPKQSECNIICGGHGAGCDSFNMNAQNSSKLNVQVSSTDPSSSMTIRCPIDNIRGNSNNCNIFGDNPTMNDLMQNMKIYAVEGVNDFILSCFGPCFTSTATLFCTEHFGSSCSIISSIGNHSISDWECIEDSSICDSYLYPTPLPTKEPTISPTPSPTITPTQPTLNPTNAPSTSPITYDPPHSSETILYVHHNGCDYGDCSFSDFYDFPTYCSDSFIYNQNPYCCSRYNPPQNIATTISVPLDCSWNMMTISDNEIFENVMIANAKSAVICFELDPDFICYHPVVSVLYEAINYDDISNGDYLDIAYENSSNLLNSAKCTAPQNCGMFQQCAVDTKSYNGDPGDGPWTGASPFKQFHILNGNGVEALCNGLTNMNVRISVDCTKRPSTCSSLNYTWYCFNGLGGYPYSSECEHYDGNGMIDLADGTFDLFDAIYLQHEQVIFRGKNWEQTIFQHTISINPNNVILIHCTWQCHVALKDIKYITSGINTTIYGTNGGNMRFENVVFENYKDLPKFFFEGSGTNISFINCIFRYNKINNGFIIQNLASVYLEGCSFHNNMIFGDLFTVFGGLLFIDNSIFIENKAKNYVNLIHSTHDENAITIMKTTFYKNNNFNAMIMQNNVAGNVLISSCGFIANYNNTYLVNVINIPYSTTISILYTMISDNNQCLSNHCLSFMNSNLLIDEISLSPGTATPTTAPTATPSAAPSTAPSVPPTNYP